jgi:hypothetical protein
MGGRDSLDGFLEGSQAPLERYDFIGAFLLRVEIETRERNFRIMSTTGGSSPEEPKPVAPPPAIRERYSPPAKVYTQSELERIIKPPFSAKAHAEKVYQNVSAYVSHGNATADNVLRLEYTDMVLDALHIERGLFIELKQFAVNGRVRYGQHIPELDQQLHRLAADIPRYMVVRHSIVDGILAPKQKQLPFPKKP